LVTEIDNQGYEYSEGDYIEIDEEDAEEWASWEILNLEVKQVKVNGNTAV
jgi:hypothetical protein